MKNFFDKLIEEYFGNIDTEVKIIFKHSVYFFQIKSLKLTPFTFLQQNKPFEKGIHSHWLETLNLYETNL